LFPLINNSTTYGNYLTLFCVQIANITPNL